MKGILDELYDLKFFHLTVIADVDGAYKSVMDSLLKADAKLSKTFPNCKDILDECPSAGIDWHNFSNRNEF